MVELVLAGVIIAAVAAAVVVTGVRDHRRRRAERLAAEADRMPRGEPIPSGWPDGGSVEDRSPAP
ncbi:hypothetical protein [Glycomyces sp. NPDC048151]|uniref:hypothetical protein n=1 Tax=Glycomyces sp. NPDC048151 TaxID=3364002 RepID=UPI0037194FAE